MKAAYKHIRSVTAQISFAVAAAIATGPVYAQTAAKPPAKTVAKTAAKSADCAEAQKTVNEKGFKGYTLSDLTSHPTLAGETQKITIQLKDALNRVTSDSCDIKIPKIDFRHPIASAMVEFRRTLALDQRKARDVAQRFGKLIEEKAGTVGNPQTLAFLKTLQDNLKGAKDPDALESIVRDMWEAMQRLEKDTMSAAERRLREMEQALRDALERGASEEEIRKLTEDALKAMKEALKEQAEKAAKDMDAQAKKDFEEMQKKIDEMKKMLEELQKMDPKMAQEMQKMMQQLQEMMKQEQQQSQKSQQAQSSEKSQQQQQQQKQEQQQARQSMQQKMEQMKQRLQQQQQNQKMQQELSELIQKQEELRNETAEDREKRKEDMAKVLAQLEKYAEELKKQINDNRSKEYNELYNGPLNTERDPGDHSYNRALPSYMKMLAKGETILLAEATPGPTGNLTPGRVMHYDDIQRRIKRLEELDKDFTGAQKELKDKRENEQQLKESEAEDYISRFQKIQSELEQQQEERQKAQDQNQKTPDEQQKQQEQRQQQQEQQQKQKDMLERIQQMIEQMRKKDQQKQQQKQQQDQNQKPGGEKKPQSEQQKELQKQLEELMKKMREKGMDPGKLKDAGESMDGASQELDQGDPGDAVPKQDDALGHLREGQKEMQKQMESKPGSQPGEGEGPGDGEGHEATQKIPTDVLGRRMPRDAQDLGTLDNENISRERREQINLRLKDQKIPKTERQYLENLLKGGTGRITPKVVQKPVP